MKFTTQSVDRNGMSLRTYIDGISMDEVLKTFPEGRMSGYYDSEKGYDNDEVGFVDSEGNQYYVYARWGHVRVGGLDTSPYAEELAKFVKEMVEGK